MNKKVKEVIARELVLVAKDLTSASYGVGDWIMQKFSETHEPSYGLIIAEQNNGSFKAVVGGGGQRKATIKSLKGWNPSPRKIDKSDVPQKIANTVEKKVRSMRASNKKAGFGFSVKEYSRKGNVFFIEEYIKLQSSILVDEVEKSASMWMKSFEKELSRIPNAYTKTGTPKIEVISGKMNFHLFASGRLEDTVGYEEDGIAFDEFVQGIGYRNRG